MPAVFPGAYNTFVPSHEASGKLVVDYSRDIKKFAVNKYTQLVPVEEILGWYLEMTVEEAGRILQTDLSNFEWPDGVPAREGNDETESFEFKPFRCKRKQYPALLGDLTIDQASWDILAQHLSIKSRQAMTARTQAAITVFTTTGNYAADHVMTVSSISGNTGTWAASTTARQDIKRSINTAVEKIYDDTLAAVEKDQLQLVINSELAARISECQEIVDYIKGSPDALAEIKGELSGQNDNSEHGLPSNLYGVPLVVEKTRKVTSKKGATRAVSQVLPTATPFLCARPGELEGVANSPTFSTVTMFIQEEMSVETKRDTDNRRTIGRVVENYTHVMTAPASGVLFQGAV